MLAINLLSHQRSALIFVALTSSKDMTRKARGGQPWDVTSGYPGRLGSRTRSRFRFPIRNTNTNIVNSNNNSNNRASSPTFEVCLNCPQPILIPGHLIQNDLTAESLLESISPLIHRENQTITDPGCCARTTLDFSPGSICPPTQV